MKYKIVASDLDGTLLNNKSELSDKNAAAIKELARRGVYFVPATGRAFAEFPEQVKNCSDIRYAIHSNGAVVFDKVSGEKILFTIKKDEAESLFKMLFSTEAHVTARHNGKSYADAFDSEGAKYFNIDANHAAVISKYASFPADFRSFICELGDIEVVSAYFHSEAERAACYEKITAMGRLKAVPVEPIGLEIFDKSAGKGAALRALCDELKIDYADTIAVGDSSNDITLLEAAGLGLAVENGGESIKKVARQTICSNENDAIAYILKNFYSND